MLDLGKIYLQAGNYAEARAQFSRALDNNSNNKEAWGLLGITAILSGNFPEGDAYFRKLSIATDEIIEQIVNVLLMYKRPEPLMTFITSVEQDLSPSSRQALEYYYGLTDLSPALTQLEEDYKLVFWTLNIRREVLKRWNAFIYEGGRLRLSEDVMIELRDARLGQQSS